MYLVGRRWRYGASPGLTRFWPSAATNTLHRLNILSKAYIVNTALSLVNVTLEHPDGDGTLKVPDGVNLRFAPGEFFSLIGPSGSGRSSLLLAVAATLVRPTAGRPGGGEATRRAAALLELVGLAPAAGNCEALSPGHGRVRGGDRDRHPRYWFSPLTDMVARMRDGRLSAPRAGAD